MLSNVIVGIGVAVAAVITVLGEMYVVAHAATYIEPILAARWAAKTAARATRSWEDWLNAEQVVREASLTTWAAWGFEPQAVDYYNEVWAKAQSSADRARDRAQRAQARADKARAWAARSRAING